MASSNRFKKSVESATDNTTYNATDNIRENITYNITDNTLTNATENILYSTTDNILDDILRTNKKDRGKNHTIYLSAEVSNALNSQTKKSKMSKSEMVDRILRKVLLNQ